MVNANSVIIILLFKKENLTPITEFYYTKMIKEKLIT
jgi:hypothetical protein